MSVATAITYFVVSVLFLVGIIGLCYWPFDKSHDKHNGFIGAMFMFLLAWIVAWLGGI